MFQTTQEYEAFDNLKYQPITHDFAQLLNSGDFVTFRDSGSICPRPTYFQNVYLSHYKTEATANSPWFLTALFKGLAFYFAEQAGEEIGGTIGSGIGELLTNGECTPTEFGEVCDGFATAGEILGGTTAAGLATSALTALNLAIPLSPAVVHDAELFDKIEVQGFGDILPDLIQVASMPGNIAQIQQLPRLESTISFVDKDLIFGVVVDATGQPIPGTDLNAFLLEDIEGNTVFGVLVSNDISVSGRPLSMSDRAKIELENVFPGVPDGAMVDVVSTLLIANPQLDDRLNELCPPESFFWWTRDTSGGWNNEDNWSDGTSVPNDSDAIAVFGHHNASPLTVTTTSNVTVRALQFGEGSLDLPGSNIVIAGSGNINIASETCCAASAYILATMSYRLA